MNLDSDVADLCQFDKVSEDDHPTRGTAPSNNSTQEETHSFVKDDFEDI